MLKTTKANERAFAIERARSFIAERFPAVVDSEINAERIAGDVRRRQLEELEKFAAVQGGASKDLAVKFGLDEDHWLVRFFFRHPKGVASTLPPTIVRVYDEEDRIEVGATL